MGTNRRPFQVASRVLLVAFVLSLAVVLSNPQAVRLAILAKSQPPGPVLSDDITILAATAEPAVAEPAVAEPAVADPTFGRQPAWVTQAHDGSGPTDATHLPTRAEHPETVTPPDFNSDAKVAGDVLDARRISSATNGFSWDPTDTRTTIQGRTMPILSPEGLQGPDRRGEYFELPPPPGWEDALVSLSESVTLGPSVTDDWAEPAAPSEASTDWSQQHAVDAQAAQERLEAEITDLRRVIGLFTESQQIGLQLDQLQRGQQELLQLHQSLPVDRMIQLLDLLKGEMQSIHEAIPQPPHEIRRNGPSLQGAVSQAEEARLSLPPPGNPSPMRLLPAQPPRHLTEQPTVRQTAWSPRCVSCHSRHATH